MARSQRPVAVLGIGAMGHGMARSALLARDLGMLGALAPGAIWAQMSTIGVRGIERVASLVDKERPDITLVDAPVSGSKDPAEQGQLTIFAAGP